jgi:hypothetical protein
MEITNKETSEYTSIVELKTWQLLLWYKRLEAPLISCAHKSIYSVKGITRSYATKPRELKINWL